MKVLHLLQSNQFSGAENVVCQIIGMFKDNESVEMAYCSQDGPIKDALSERNITFYPMSVLCVAEVKRVINEYKPDIIHAHDMRASFVAARSCGKIPLISHIHNNAFQSRGLSVKSIAYILAAKKAKHIFWVSESAYNGYFFKRFFKKKSSVLRNIIDIDSLRKKMNCDSNCYDYDVVYVGRLTYPKHPERMIEVLSKVCEKKSDVKIAIVGTGDLEDVTKQLVAEKGIENNVDFLGFRSNPLKIMHDAKVMIMTSRWEGTPMCALEAQSLGLPIVSTPTDGLCEIINDGKNGFLSNDNSVLADKIVEIITDFELRSLMKQDSILIMNEIMKKTTYISRLSDFYF